MLPQNARRAQPRAPALGDAAGVCYDSGMDQKRWEERLDRVADRVADAVSEGVHVIEDAFDKGRDTIHEDIGSRRTGPATGEEPSAGRSKRSVRLGVLLVGIGILWLLYSLGILRHPVVPIVLIVIGVYFIVRSK